MCVLVLLPRLNTTGFHSSWCFFLSNKTRNNVLSILFLKTPVTRITDLDVKRRPCLHLRLNLKHTVVALKCIQSCVLKTTKPYYLINISMFLVMELCSNAFLSYRCLGYDSLSVVAIHRVVCRRTIFRPDNSLIYSSNRQQFSFHLMVRILGELSNPCSFKSCNYINALISNLFDQQTWK